MLRRPGEPLSAPADDRAERGLPIGEAAYPVPFRQGLEYASLVRGTSPEPTRSMSAPPDACAASS